MREVKERLARVASSDSNVLITGETGTGKELVAELVHLKSARRKKPFVTMLFPTLCWRVNCLGTERGIYRGALEQRGQDAVGGQWYGPSR